MAEFYLHGDGTAQNHPRALVLLGQAAQLGAEWACFILGKGHYHGSYGLDKDLQEAARWLRKMPSCSLQNATSVCRDKAAQMLAKIGE